MFHRSITIGNKSSFFLFGPRGTGKSTLIRQQLAKFEPLWIDLLQPEQEDLYRLSPQSLGDEIAKSVGKIRWVVIDEVQKIPRLLDLVHSLIESTGVLFALTGSSARKLKRGGANLLAGRAFVHHLHPLTHVELGDRFLLDEVLRWGTLPRLFSLQAPEDRTEFLRSYALTYLKEEIQAEQIVRRLDPFRRFLQVAAQTNGEIVNATNIGRDVGADTKTVQSYFQILEDTLLGFSLESHHRSLRKQQRQAAKFFLFDPGIKRALDGTLNQDLTPGTYGYGKAFEHFIILEALRLNSYKRRDFRFSYLRTKDGAEIDLIVERPGLPAVLIEIKSSDRVDDRDTRALERFLPDFPKAEAFCFSRDPRGKKIGRVSALPWNEGLKEIGLA